MRHPLRIYFEKLLLEIVARYRETDPTCPEKLEDWMGGHIEGFQDDLQQRTKGRISTRWFYNHLKTTREDRLPRIDVLNLLAQYTGYEDWDGFVRAKKQQGVRPDVRQVGTNKKTKRLLTGMIAITTVLIGAWAWWSQGPEIHSCTFCFVDSDFGGTLNEVGLSVISLTADESPKELKVDSNACIQYSTREQSVKLVASADYYQTDTITRSLIRPCNEVVALKSDDYAVLINIFSRNNYEDWKRRRQHIERMFAEDAKIFQVDFNSRRAVELYTRDEFIDKLSMPIASLRNIEVLETVYYEGRISTMRFTQTTK